MLYELKTYKDIDATDKGIKQDDFCDCAFVNCKFVNTKFYLCSFKDCTFSDCTIESPVFEQCGMQNCIFEDCRLSGISWGDLNTISKIIDANPASRYSRCFFRYNTFARMDLSKYDFSESKFKNCFFDQCNLSDASFYGCDMNGSELQGCDLRKADFRESEGWLMDIRRNNVKYASFSLKDAALLLSAFEIKLS